ncbi:transposable element Tcb1 transposase [Trichonephila clavipes]|nr:transposable element Tcb1 transposase [Trichonephila clavipes]
MSSRHHIDDFMRGRIIGKIEEGRKITDVAREFDIAHSVVSRLWKSFKTTGMCSRRHGGGRVRSTTPAEDRYIVLSAKRNRCTTAQQVANQFLAASGKQISRKTVARRLRGGGLYARRPVVCVPLTRQYCTARLQWCREHHNYTEQDWACVLFSDESRFNLSSDCRRQLIWRKWTILDRVLGARAAGVHYRLFSVWTLVPVRLDQQLSDHSTVDEIASGAADCRLTYTMANCPQRRKEEGKREREKEGKRARKRQGLVVLGSREENPRVLLGDADQESETRMSKNALWTGRRQAVE